MKKILFLLLLISVKTIWATQAVIAVSLGMPDLVLKQYIKQAHELKIPLVIRGLYTNPQDTSVNNKIGSFADTANRMKALIGKSKQGGIAIDPMVFRAFNIKAVPQLVVFDSSDCIRSKQNTCNANSYDVIKGNIPVQRSLEIIHDKTQSATRRQYIGSLLVKIGDNHV